MHAKTPKPSAARRPLDRSAAGRLPVGFDVVARLLPHAPGFMPVAASALFAGRMLRIRGLALVVPLAAMALSATPLLGPTTGASTLVVYARDHAAGASPACWRGAGAARRCRSPVDACPAR